jgi:hypothetical protein
MSHRESAERPRAPEPAGRLLGGAAFAALRDLRRVFARGGMPSRASRSPDEDARLAVFQTLNELVHVLDQFRRCIERGEGVRLVVTERGRQVGRAVVEIAIVPGSDGGLTPGKPGSPG